jgi:hypothetical protein
MFGSWLGSLVILAAPPMRADVTRYGFGEGYADSLKR